MNSLAAALLLLCVVLGSGAASAADAPVPWKGLQVLQGTRAYVDTPLGQVHTTAMGAGIPVILLHQTPWFSVQYAKAQPLLAQKFRAIAVDTPGYGMSTVPDHPPTAEEYADNLAVVLDKLGIKTAVLVGHHTGSTIAAAFAARHPERTRCVVMHGVPLYTPAERADRLKNQLHPDTTLNADGSHFTARWKNIEDNYLKGAGTTESLQWSVMSFLIAGSTEWYGHQAAFTFDMQAAIKAIKAPTLIMSNTADSIHQASARVLKMRPDFAYHEFAGGTSHMMYDTPGPWADAISAFISDKCAK